MSLDLFRATLGIDIQNDDLTSNAYVLQGSGAPGTRTEENDAPVGSIYMRTDDFDPAEKLQFYWKHTAGSGTDKWTLAASKEFVESAVQGISWREPVVALDTTSYAAITNAETVLNDTVTPGTLGGVDVTTLVEGDRIVFTDVAGGPTNVLIVTGTPGGAPGATLVDSTGNSLTDGDAVLVNEGDEADSQWIFDGTNWIKFGGAGSAAELQFIRDYIGKGIPGLKLPDYLSEDIITDADPLDTSISKLDDAIGDLQFTEQNLLTNFTRVIGSPDYNSTTDITADLDLIDQAMGDGEITNDGGNYALSDDMSWGAAGTLDLTDALNELNDAIGDRDYAGNNYVTDGESISDSIDAIDSALGDNITQTGSWTTGGFLDTTELTTAPTGGTVTNILDSFNQEIGDLSDDTLEITGGPVTGPTPTEIDTVPASEVTEIKWMLQVKDGSNNRRAFEIHALTDGTTVDFNRFSVLRVGAGSTGAVGVDVTINGSSEIALSIAPANALTYTVKRISKSFLA